MHHPGCWVTNGGCATEAQHRVAPSAMAYTAHERPPGDPAPHPGEGTRISPPPAAIETPPDPIPFRPAHRPQAAVPPLEEEPGPVIGDPAAPPSAMVHRTLPSTVGTPASPRRYQPPAGDHMPRRQMPKIYDRHPIFGYWYVPAAVLLAIAIAFGVIWLGGKLTGGDSSPAASATPAPTSPAGAGQTATSVVTPAATPTSGQSPSPTASTGPGKFKAGDLLVVTGTGECLNVRTKAGTTNDAIVCVKDGTELKVTGGPEVAGQLTWWKVQTELGEGWAAEDYLVKKP